MTVWADEENCQWIIDVLSQVSAAGIVLNRLRLQLEMPHKKVDVIDALWLLVLDFDALDEVLAHPSFVNTRITICLASPMHQFRRRKWDADGSKCEIVKAKLNRTAARGMLEVKFLDE